MLPTVESLSDRSNQFGPEESDSVTRANCLYWLEIYDLNSQTPVT